MIENLIGNLMKRVGQYAYLVGQIKGIIATNNPEEATRKITEVIAKFEGEVSDKKTTPE